MIGLTPGEKKFKQEWDALTKAEQWEQHLELYRRYHNNLKLQIQTTVAQFPELKVEPKRKS